MLGLLLVIHLNLNCRTSFPTCYSVGMSLVSFLTLTSISKKERCCNSGRCGKEISLWILKHCLHHDLNENIKKQKFHP